MTEQPHQTNPENDPCERAYPTLSERDAALVDRLIAGETIGPDDVPAGMPPESDAERVERAQRLLGLLKHWQAPDPEAGFASQTVGQVLCADPVKVSDADGEALAALLELRRQGLETGPMPAGAKVRAERVAGVLSLMDRVKDEPVPGGLVKRTMQTIERDREEERRRSAMRIGGPNDTRPGGFNIRQLATTAALLLMVLSVLVPMLQKGQRDAQIAECSQNLAGLGADLQSFAIDNKASARPTASTHSPGIFKELSGFARKDLDGAEVPASRVNLFVLLDQRRIESQHMACPSADPKTNAGYYNGQNPIAGGPLRVFLQSRPIFSDTNPLYRVTPKGLVRDTTIPGLTRSQNHDGVGQNVLVSDGSVKWTVRPAVLNTSKQEDNIWLLQPSGDAQSEPDVFLTP